MLLLTTKSRMKLLVKYIQENYHIYNAAEPLFEIDGTSPINSMAALLKNKGAAPGEPKYKI